MLQSTWQRGEFSSYILFLFVVLLCQVQEETQDTPPPNRQLPARTDTKCQGGLREARSSWLLRTIIVALVCQRAGKHYTGRRGATPRLFRCGTKKRPAMSASHEFVHFLVTLSNRSIRRGKAGLLLFFEKKLNIYS